MEHERKFLIWQMASNVVSKYVAKLNRAIAKWFLAVMDLAVEC